MSCTLGLQKDQNTLTTKHRGHGNYDITHMWSKALNEAKAVVSKSKANRALSPNNATTLNTKLKLFPILTDSSSSKPQRLKLKLHRFLHQWNPRRLLLPTKLPPPYLMNAPPRFLPAITPFGLTSHPFSTPLAEVFFFSFF